MAAKATIYTGDAVGIPQGSNNPLVITFDEDVEVSSIVISLWDRKSGTDEPLKVWTEEDVTIEEENVICPLSEEETAGFPAGKLLLEIKGLDEDGNTLFWQEITVRILHRYDKGIPLSESDSA